MLFTTPPLRGFTTTRATAAGDTAFAVLVPPFPGPVNSNPFLYKLGQNLFPNWWTSPMNGVAHLTTINLLAVAGGTTSHSLYVLRPKNFTYFPAGLAVNLTLIPNSTATGIAADPGLYATKYRYPTAGDPGTTGIYSTPPGQVADNAIAANDYVAYQLADGSWQLDLIASGTFGSSLTLTTGTPNRTGGAIPAMSPLFFFGAAADADPATGGVDPAYETIAAVRNQIQDGITGLCHGIHPGDPLVLYDANTTDADAVCAAGYYSTW